VAEDAEFLLEVTVRRCVFVLEYAELEHHCLLHWVTLVRSRTETLKVDQDAYLNPFHLL
jgi:hypothetical protein